MKKKAWKRLAKDHEVMVRYWYGMCLKLLDDKQDLEVNVNGLSAALAAAHYQLSQQAAEMDRRRADATLAEAEELS